MNNLKTLLLVILLTSPSLGLTMDFSGYDIKTVEFNPSPDVKDKLEVYNEHFKKLCSVEFGEKYRFSSYLEQQEPLTAAQKNRMNTLEIMAKQAFHEGRTYDIQNYRAEYRSIISNLKRHYFALCVYAGPSKKSQWSQNINRLLVDFEMFLMKMGYYDFKFRLLGKI